MNPVFALESKKALFIVNLIIMQRMHNKVIFVTIFFPPTRSVMIMQRMHKKVNFVKNFLSLFLAVFLLTKYLFKTIKTE